MKSLETLELECETWPPLLEEYERGYITGSLRGERNIYKLQISFDRLLLDALNPRRGVAFLKSLKQEKV